MANNVAFLRGSQAKFDGLKSFNAGAFYLTEDAGRLYYANSETTCLELNQYVHQVASFDELASSFASAQVGDFYYAIKENVLCTKKEGATSWTQINKNTNDNDDTKVTSVSFKRDETVTDKIKMNLVLKQTTHHIDNSTTEVADVIGSFELTENDFNAIVDGANVSVGANVETNKAIIKTAGIGADSADAGISIAGAGSVTIGGTADNIVITGVNSTYGLGSAANKAEIVLTGSDNVEDTIAFVGGNDDIVVTGEKEDEIKIAHKAYEDVAAAFGAQTPVAGGEFNVVNGVTLSNGHVTGITTAKVTLPGEKWYTVSKVEANAEGDLTITVKDQANSETEVKAEKQLYYKVGDALVYNQGDLKDYFYTEAEIDDKLNGLNAMTYRGTVGSTAEVVVTGAVAALPTTGVKIGDTYMVVGADGVNYGGAEKAGAGDLLIATGVEENGVIVSGLAWTYVPSANEIDTTYDLIVEDTKIVLSGSDNSADAVSIDGDVDFIITAQNAKGDGIKISHADIARNDGEKGAISPAAKASFDVVQEVTSDAKGHITAVKTTTVTLPEDKDTTYSLNLDAENKKFALKDSGNVEQGAVSIDGDGVIEVAAAVEAGVLGYSLSHADVARNDGDVKTQGLINKENKNKFAVVTGVTSNEQGHITAVEKTEFTLPAEVTYTLSGAVAAVEGGVSITDTLTNSNNVACGTSVYSLKSESLKVANTNNNVTVELEWGTF